MNPKHINPKHILITSMSNMLTHYGLVTVGMPSGDIDLGEHWLR